MIAAGRREEALSPAELDKARRDLRRMLRGKRLSASWIEAHAEGLLAQACLEYAAKVAEDGPAVRPVGWLLNTAWWRALDLLAQEGRQPSTFSVEEAHQLPDTASKTPEEEALEHDANERLRAAIAHLPEREQRLLSLVYFGDRSVEEAGSALGWSRSSAKRHHAAALARMRAFFGDERNLQSPALLGLLGWCFGLARDRLGSALAALRTGRAALGELATAASQRVADAWRRLLPLSEPGSAATLGGSGRALDACGLAAVTLACGVAASGIVPVTSGEGNDSARSKNDPPASVARQAAPTLPSAPSRNSPTARSLPIESGGGARPEKQHTASVGKVSRLAGQDSQPDVPKRPVTTRNASEFGVEAGSTTSEPTTAAGSGPADTELESAPASAPQRVPSAPQRAPAGHSSSPAEFGL